MDSTILSLFFLCVQNVASCVVTTTDAYQYTDVEKNVTESTSIVFKVAACHDAHVLLHQDGDDKENNIYEIVIGGWDNTKSVIRKQQQGTPVAVAHHMPLDCEKAFPFWLEWYQGILRVGTSTDIGAGQFMNFHDPNPIEVNYISVSTGWGATGWWIFDKDNCTSNPCMNDGTCLNVLFGGYRCACTIGYGGKNCERDEDRITYSPCSDGDETCIGALIGFKCIPVFAMESEMSVEENSSGTEDEDDRKGNRNQRGGRKKGRRHKRYLYHEQRPLYFGEWFK